MNGSGHSKEYCKLLKEYSDKYAMQRTHKYRSDGKKKRENPVKFDDEMQEVKIISSQAKTYPKEKRKKNQKKILRVNQRVQTHMMI